MPELVGAEEQREAMARLVPERPEVEELVGRPEEAVDLPDIHALAVQCVPHVSHQVGQPDAVAAGLGSAMGDRQEHRDPGATALVGQPGPDHAREVRPCSPLIGVLTSGQRAGHAARRYRSGHRPTPWHTAERRVVHLARPLRWRPLRGPAGVRAGPGRGSTGPTGPHRSTGLRNPHRLEDGHPGGTAARSHWRHLAPRHGPRVVSSPVPRGVGDGKRPPAPLIDDVAIDAIPVPVGVWQVPANARCRFQRVNHGDGRFSLRRRRCHGGG